MMNQVKPIKLNQNKDFVRLYRRGKSQVHPLLVTYLSKNRFGQTRIGITATKKVGCAVQRNRAKRVIRAAFRTLPSAPPTGYDIIFVARTRTTTCKMQQLRGVMAEQLRRLTAPPKPVVQKPAAPKPDSTPKSGTPQ